MTSSMKQSMRVFKGVFTIQWYICTLSLKMISLFVLQLSQKMLFFLVKEYSVRLWCHPVTSSMTTSPWKYFSHIIWDDLIISDVELKLCLIFWHFQNGHHFEVATKLFTGCDTRNWICYKDSHEHLWHFELLINALAQILTELLQFQVFTYFELLWHHQWCNP